MADGVIHAAFNHDFSKFAENCAADARAIEAIGEALAGSNRPLIVTSGMPATPGRLTTEDDVPPSGPSMTPRVSEQAATSCVAREVRASVVRLPQVHDRDKQGLVTYLIALAREKRVSAYIGEGRNRWPAVHRLDVAPVYRLALEKGSAGARYHAVAEEGVPLREIAETIGRGLRLPVVALPAEEAAGHFGWLRYFAGHGRSRCKRTNAATAGMAPHAEARAHCRSQPRKRVRRLNRRVRKYDDAASLSSDGG
jgi:nucleoside-diphosphate-sugar epimerase